jgi:hypothetical protein
MNEKPSTTTTFGPFVTTLYVLLCLIPYGLLACALVASCSSGWQLTWGALGFVALAGFVSFANMVVGIFLVASIIFTIVLLRRPVNKLVCAIVLTSFVLGGIGPTVCFMVFLGFAK